MVRGVSTEIKAGESPLPYQTLKVEELSESLAGITNFTGITMLCANQANILTNTHSPVRKTHRWIQAALPANKFLC